MSVVIRPARAGTKKRPVYHIVVADSRFPRDGRFIERLGYFNPLLPKDNETRLKLDLEKVKAWMAKGAQPSDRVMRFLDAAGVAKRKPRNKHKRHDSDSSDEFEDGKVMTPGKGATLIGDGPSALTRVTMLGDDFGFDPGIGMCGKSGQSVPVGVGQPSLKITGLTVGGTSL